MKFSIITPTYNMLNYLKLCHASIMDQEDVIVEHIIIDGGSNDGTVGWIKQNCANKSISEKDKGMYDAVNKGFRLADGEIVAYLNCDEQYLPGTLNKVRNLFNNHLEIDIIFGNALIIDPEGKLISYRKSYKPFSTLIKVSHLYLLSCTIFFRRRIIDEGVFFDEKFKAWGDTHLILTLLYKKYKFLHLKDYLSVFTWTGKNMSTGANAMKEKEMLYFSLPKIVRLFKIPINLSRIFLKLFSGAYFQKFPISYSIYTMESNSKRKSFESSNVSFKWPVN